MEKVNSITAELLAKATDYLPNAKKQELVEAYAPYCFDKLQLRAGDNELPPMNAENAANKARCVATALYAEYLHLPVEYDAETENTLITWECFDAYGAAHVINQIERQKTDATVRDKCFDLLQDYRDFEKRLNVHLYGLMNVMNDAASRLLTTMASPETTESIDKALEELKGAENMLKQQLSGISGGKSEKDVESNGG